MKIISHRGNGNIYKKNTKEALLEALNKDYIDGIEFDVRMTIDKKIVIIHDPLIDFVSDGHGFVKKMTLRKLLKYNFGTSTFPSKICTLDNFLSIINTNKIIMIEIKDEGKDFKEKVDLIYKIINKYPHLNIYLTSFNYELLLYLNNSYKVNCGLLIAYFLNNKRFYNHFSFNIVEYNYKNRVSTKKETFLFGILGPDINEFNILTDYPYLFKE